MDSVVIAEDEQRPEKKEKQGSWMKETSERVSQVIMNGVFFERERGDATVPAGFLSRAVGRGEN